MVIVFWLFANRSFCQAPSWTAPDGPSFAYAADVTALLYVDGQLSNNPLDSIAYFHNGQLLGLSATFEVNDTLYFFIPVFSNKALGDTLEAKVYSSVHDGVFAASQKIVFRHLESYGSVTNPLIIEVYNDGDFPIALNTFPEQETFQGTTFDTLFLSEILIQRDSDIVDWSFIPNPDLFVQLLGDTLIILPDPNFFGATSLSIGVVERTANAYSASTTISLYVRQGYAPPNWIGPLEQHYEPGETPVAIDLNGQLDHGGGDCLEFQIYPRIDTMIPPEPYPGWVAGGDNLAQGVTLVLKAGYTPDYIFENPGDSMAVFIDGELRAVASPTLSGGEWVYFLLVRHTAIRADMKVSFYSETHGRLFELPYNLPFVTNTELGNTDEPYLVDFAPLSLSVSEDGMLSSTLQLDTFKGIVYYDIIARDCDNPENLADTTSAFICYYTDTDGDGICDLEDIAVNDACDPPQQSGYQGYNPSNMIWAAADCDGDGVINGIEYADGTDPYSLCDFIKESITVAQTGVWATADCDGDGIINGEEGDEEVDTDQDGIPDFLDLESDGDGVLDSRELADGTDQKEVCDFVLAHITEEQNDYWSAADCDGDGLLNGFEGDEEVDTDSDGIPDFVDWDSDNDGLLDVTEQGNLVSADIDGDSVLNYLDLDSDGDYCLDAIEGSEPFRATDVDSLGRLYNPGLLVQVDSNGVPLMVADGMVGQLRGENWGDPTLFDLNCSFGISGKVWLDNDRNGRSTGESPLSRAYVMLKGESYSGRVVEEQLQTSNSGTYEFTEVFFGDYEMSVSFAQLPDDTAYVFTIPDVEGNTYDESDSDFSLETGKVVVPQPSGYLGIRNLDAGVFIDRDRDFIPDVIDPNTAETDLIDPQGYVYCESSGEIISGGSVSVTGPGRVYMIKDGSDGTYQWFVDAAGYYTQIYTPPAGYSLSGTCGLTDTLDPDPGVTLLGSGAKKGFDQLAEVFCADNPYYRVFYLTPEDLVLTNNIPLSCMECTVPNRLKVREVTATDALLSWHSTNLPLNDNTCWTVKLGPPGFLPSDAGEDIVQVSVCASNPNVEIREDTIILSLPEGTLQPGTEYLYYVAERCGSEGISQWRCLPLEDVFRTYDAPFEASASDFVAATCREGSEGFVPDGFMSISIEDVSCEGKYTIRQLEGPQVLSPPAYEGVGAGTYQFAGAGGGDYLFELVEYGSQCRLVDTSMQLRIVMAGGIDEEAPVFVSSPDPEYNIVTGNCGSDRGLISFEARAVDGCEGEVSIATLLIGTSGNPEGFVQEISAGMYVVNAGVGTYSLLMEATDSSGNSTVIQSKLIVKQEQANFDALSCEDEVVVKLGDNCEVLIEPFMLLQGDFGCLGARDFDITIGDSNTDNGPIADGAGRYPYHIALAEYPTQDGLAGDFAPGFWSLLHSSNNRISINKDSIQLFRDTVEGHLSAAFVLPARGELSFHLRGEGAAEGFEMLLLDETGSRVETFSPTLPIDTTISWRGESAWTLIAQSSAGSGLFEAVVDGFSFDYEGSRLSDFDFCGGYIVVEDKSLPEGVLPNDTRQAMRMRFFNEWEGRLTEDKRMAPDDFSCLPGFIPDTLAVSPYASWTFMPSAAGIYTFESSSDMALSLALYQQSSDESRSIATPDANNGWFDKVNPCRNLVGTVLTGDWNAGKLRMSLPLKAKHEYTLLVLGVGEGDFAIEVEKDGEGDAIVGYELPESGFFPVREEAKAYPLYCSDVDSLLLPGVGPHCYEIGSPFTESAITIAPYLEKHLSYTGFPEVSDNCGPVTVCVSDKLISNGDCGEGVIERRFTMEDAAKNKGEWTDSTGLIGIQRIYFSPIPMTAINRASSVQYLECDESFALDSLGYPHPSVTGYPFVASAFGFHDLAYEWCNLAASYRDVSSSSGCAGGLGLEREWTILNWCRPSDLQIVRQVIRIGDFTPPILEIETTDKDLIRIDALPGACYGKLTLPGIRVTDNCSGVDSSGVIWEEEVLVPVVDVFGNWVGEYKEWQIRGEYAPGDTLSGAQPGKTYRLVYEARDECGNTARQFTGLSVLENVAPFVACKENLAVKLSNGVATLSRSLFLADVGDNCEIVDFYVRRQLDSAALAFYEASGLSSKKRTDTDTTVWVSNHRINANGRELRIFEDTLDGEGYVWQDEVLFVCSDTDKEVVVEVLVVDGSGNRTSCWLTVSVENEELPIIIPPVNFRLGCTDSGIALPPDREAYLDLTEEARSILHKELDERFGPASLVFACGDFSLEQSLAVIQLHCGAGYILREFEVLDANGNLAGFPATQRVTLDADYDYAFSLPADASGNCSSLKASVKWQHEESRCNLLSVYTRDEHYQTGSDYCYQIWRTYEIVNWCQFEGTDLSVANPFVIGRDEDGDGIPGNTSLIIRYETLEAQNVSKDFVVIDVDTLSSNGILRKEEYDGGYYEYTQLLEVYDADAPNVSSHEKLEFCANGEDCSTAIVFEAIIKDMCTVDRFFVSANVVGLNGEVHALTTGEAEYYSDSAAVQIAGTLAIGVYVVELTVTDACSNSASWRDTLRVIDCSAPGLVSMDELSVNLSGFDSNNDGSVDEGKARVWAEEFVLETGPDCSAPMHYSIHTEGISSLLDSLVANVGQGKSGRLSDYLDPTQSSVELGCDRAGRTIPVLIAVWDACGNGNYNMSKIRVSDGSEWCGEVASGPSIAGKVTRSGGGGLAGAEVQLSGAIEEQVLSGESGAFSFGNLTGGADYTVKPELDEDHRNGLSTLDVIAIGKHILNVKLLDSPYKMIAADIDNNGVVSSLDLIELKRLILGVNERLLHNSSWRFVRSDYVFPDPTNPWQQPFPEVYNANNLDHSVSDADFVGVKIGDVTQDAQLWGTAVSEVRELSAGMTLEVREVALEGSEIRLDFYASTMAQVEGFQLGLSWNPELMSWRNLIPGALEWEDFGLHLLEEGALTLSRSEGFPVDARLFSLEFSTRQEVEINRELKLSERTISPEAYLFSGLKTGLSLSFGNPPKATLLENHPNPFSGQTSIRFRLGAKSDLRIRVTNTHGKLLQIMEGTYEAGVHEWKFDTRGRFPAGVLFYTLEMEGYRETKKMVIIE